MDTQLGDEERGPFVRFQSSSELSGGGDEPASFRFPLSERSQDGTEGDTELSMPLLEWDPLFTMKQFKWEPRSHGLSGNSRALYSHLSVRDKENVAWCVFPATVNVSGRYGWPVCIVLSPKAGMGKWCHFC